MVVWLHGLRTNLALTFALIVLQSQIAAQEKAGAGKIQSAVDLFNFRDRLEAHCIDGSVIRFKLMDAKIPLKTDYGLIEISSEDIRRIDFAERLPAEVSERIKASIAKLGSDDYDSREAASAELLGLGRVAYRAVMAACQATDVEVVARAEVLADAIRRAAPPQDLEFSEYDLVCTDKSQFAGMIQLDALSVDTTPLGKQKIRLDVLRRVESGNETPENVMADPGHLMNFRNSVGKTIYFRLSAQPQQLRGTVWGTDSYTLDSNLTMAAVHAGALLPGQTKVVGVTILGPQNAFGGSVRNNIQSMPYGNFQGAFKFNTARARPARGVAQPGFGRPQNAVPVQPF
jgi:hypothetical protein